jgi:hypothetical protein
MEIGSALISAPCQLSGASSGRSLSVSASPPNSSACVALKRSCPWSRPGERPRRCSTDIFSCASSNKWRAINPTFGVLCLVRVGDCPARCPDYEVEALQAMVVGGFVRLPDKPPPAAPRAFKRGERVKIIGGPFEGVRAIHSGMRAGDRERILLSLLGSSARPVIIPSHQVAAAQ